VLQTAGLVGVRRGKERAVSTRDPRTLMDELLAAERSGVRLDPVFFWGHTPRRDGSLGPSCLSQWWPAPFTIGTQTFATAEHYMMWVKAVTFDDESAARRILQTTSAQEAKWLGRSVHQFASAVWQRQSWGTVLDGNRAKFTQHPDLGQFLLGTGNQTIVEASPVDAEWGIGLSADDPDALQPSRWKGTNRLGFALMQVRSELR